MPLTSAVGRDQVISSTERPFSPAGIAVCIGCAMALWATGVLTINQALAGFGDPATVFVASLFVVSGALEKTGLTAWTGQMLARGSGESRVRLIVLMMLFCGILSAIISVNGAVAALLPVVVVLSVRLKRPPSQLLMPLVFGAHAGSKLALTGTPVNVLVYEASLDAGAGGFGYFEFAYAGVFLLIGTIALALLLGPRLLPRRENRSLPPDLSRHARTLVEQFRLDDGVHQLRVRPESPLLGRPRAELDLGDRPGVSLLTVQEAAGTGAARLGAIEVGDLIAVRADAGTIAGLAAELVLSPADAEGVKFESGLFTTASGLAEVIIPPRSTLIGERLFPGMVTPSGNLVVLAIHRHGRDLSPGEPLQKGDILLLQGTWDALATYIAPPEALVVDSPDLVRRQVVPMGRDALVALAIMAVMVLLLATGLVPAAVAGIARGRCGAPRRHPEPRGDLSVDQLDHRDPRRRDDAPLDRDHRNRSGAAPRHPAHRRVRRLRPARAPRRALRADRDPRPGDLEHRHRAHHHPDLGRRRGADGPLAPAGADVGRDRRRRRLPDPGGDPHQPHGDGARRLPLRRLLEVRAADDALVLRHRRRPRAGDLAVLSVSS